MWIIANICVPSQTNYTLTYLAEHWQKISHDTINPYLRNEQLTPSLLWQNIKLYLKSFEEGKWFFMIQFERKYLVPVSN
jgi:hypothetical protein